MKVDIAYWVKKSEDGSSVKAACEVLSFITELQGQPTQQSGYLTLTKVAEELGFKLIDKGNDGKIVVCGSLRQAGAMSSLFKAIGAKSQGLVMCGKQPGVKLAFA